jgi:hypothetical protein
VNCPKCGHPTNKHRDAGCFVQARDLSLCGCHLSPQELIAFLELDNAQLNDNLSGQYGTSAMLRSSLDAEIGTCQRLAQDNVQLREENNQLTDALYKEALRSVDAFALIIKVLSADETDRWDALNMEPFVKWVENFSKETLNEQKSER